MFTFVVLPLIPLYKGEVFATATCTLIALFIVVAVCGLCGFFGRRQT